jgi:hypothetical protein
LILTLALRTLREQGIHQRTSNDDGAKETKLFITSAQAVTPGRSTVKCARAASRSLEPEFQGLHSNSNKLCTNSFRNVAWRMKDINSLGNPHHREVLQASMDSLQSKMLVLSWHSATSALPHALNQNCKVCIQIQTNCALTLTYSNRCISATAVCLLQLHFCYRSASATAPLLLPLHFCYRSTSATAPLLLPLRFCCPSASATSSLHLTIQLGYCFHSATTLLQLSLDACHRFTSATSDLLLPPHFGYL